MTAVQYIQKVLEDNWVESVSGRNSDVPTPTFERESAEALRRMNLDRNDYVLIMDGGISNIEPQSFGWVEEQTTARVTLDIRTAQSRERLWGQRSDDNSGTRWGGLVGEASRIIHDIRKGDEEFDLIIPYEANDLSGQMGGHIWRATLEIRLEVRASTINTEP